MNVSREEIVEAFVQALGKEAAEALIDQKMKETGLAKKEVHDFEEVERLVEALKKENVLIRNLALILMSQLRLRRMREESAVNLGQQDDDVRHK